METHGSNLDLCKMCLEISDPYHNPALLCEGKCRKKVHIKCLKRGALPSNFIGDVFYELFCTSCSESKEELLIRQKLSWLTTVVLTLYNLREKSSGLSRRGYFHWKSDISTFISNNWDQFFNKTVKKKKNWIGTISGTLSHYSGVFFKSGTLELGDQGWWKLIDNDPPEVLVEKYHKVLELKKLHQAKLKAKVNDVSKSEPIYSYEEGNSSGAESFKTKSIKPFNERNCQIEVRNQVPKSVSPCEEFIDVLDLEIDVPNIEEDFPSFNLAANTMEEEPLDFQDCNELSDIITTEFFPTISELNGVESFEDIIVSDILPIENVQDPSRIDDNKKLDQKYEDSTLNEKNIDLPLPLPSLFKKTCAKPWPWDESIKLNPDDVRPLMSEREEEYLLQKIEQYKNLLDHAPAAVRRLYRKLSVRKLKRQYGLPILNVDTFGKDIEKNNTAVRKKGNVLLDRFISEDVRIFFEQRLQGHCEPTSVHSPYTNRLLKPFIRRDTSSRPTWLKVMTELIVKVNKKKYLDYTPAPPAPIDYSYIRPQHIPAINSLCTQFFWPGVDLTECLQYPDFTCVVLYKKVVIGFAIMVPDVGYNEAYISFFLVRPEWQKAGIGTFMLYHLIQTCMGKDITLHVSATNPALILYQKFGFKQEEFIQDFYDKYILPSSKESKHALFLRLSR